MIEREYHFDKEPDREAMAAWLLDNNYLFLNSRKFIETYKGADVVQPETLVMFLNCNDVFAWACADAESVTYNELPRLFDAIRADERNGLTKWVCLKRGEQPQKPIKDRMVKDGVWTEELDKLLPNKYDKWSKSKYAKS